MKYEDSSCTWQQLEDQGAFTVERHALKMTQPLQHGSGGTNNIRINCPSDLGRRFGRIDFSKGFSDWWFLSHIDFKVPSEHTQEGKRYSAEIQMNHFYSVTGEVAGVDNEMATVAMFLEAYDDAPPYPFLDRLICEWRKAEDRTREQCGMDSVEPYPGCFDPKRGQTPFPPTANETPEPTTAEPSGITPTIEPVDLNAAPSFEPSIQPSSPSALPSDEPSTQRIDRPDGPEPTAISPPTVASTPGATPAPSEPDMPPTNATEVPHTSPPVSETPAPVPDIPAPVNETRVPVDVTPSPVSTSPTLVTPSLVAETSSPVSPTSTPIADATAPAADTPTPVADTAAPVADTTAPVVDTTAPVADTAAPVADTPTSVADTAVPVTAASPVADTPTPVADTAAPVTDTTAPVVDTAAPVADTSDSVVNTANPVADTPDSEIAENTVRRFLRRSVKDVLVDNMEKSEEEKDRIVLDPENFRPADRTDEEWAAWIEAYSAHDRGVATEQQRYLLEKEVIPFHNYQFLIDVKTEYYFRYSGTQTVPPCYGPFTRASRGNTNHWRVMKDPIRVHPRQIAEMERLLKERIAPPDDKHNACENDTAGKVDEDGHISVARPLMHNALGHYKVSAKMLNA